MSTPYQELLSALAEEIGLNNTELFATQEVIIDGLPVGLHLEEQDEKTEVMLCSLLGSIHPDRVAEVSRTMLLANHLWAGTGGATLGLLPEDDQVTLSARQALSELNAKNLSEKLSRLVQIGLAWQEFITSNHGTQSIPPALYGMRA